MPPKNKKGILFLVHQGFSFIDSLMIRAKELGFESYVLTSIPAEEHQGRLGILSQTAHWMKSTPDNHLEWNDVTKALQELQADRKQIVGVLSVWEGYRILMAKANQRLGAEDVHPILLERLMDKFLMRTTLQKAGLSKINTQIISPPLLRQPLCFDGKKFLKPRTGLGSFCAHPVTKSVDAGQIAELQMQMSKDKEYNSIFSKTNDFVLEDYIPGIECSFEIIVSRSQLFVLGVHEKVEIKESEQTTLESACVSPPVHLSEKDIGEGVHFLKKCFAEFRLNTGCFHVEAKYDQKNNRWEIIEINPRVGGALIKESVQTLSGACLLKLWMKVLTSNHSMQGTIRAELQKRVTPKQNKLQQATFFRVYFGRPGSSIKKIGPMFVYPAPLLMKVTATKGTKLPLISRELFLGQALWKLKRLHLSSQLPLLQRISKKALEVRYE